MLADFQNSLLHTDNLTSSKAGALLDVLGTEIAKYLTPAELGNIERTSKSTKKHMEEMYQAAYQHYFPHIPREKGVPAKQALLQTTKDVLATLQRTKHIFVRPHTFFAIALGRKKPLSQRKEDFSSDVAYLWLGALQYSYHLEDTEHLPRARLDVLDFIPNTAYFLFLRKDYAGVEALWERHQESLRELGFSSFETACLFYAQCGYFKKLEALLCHESLSVNPMSVQRYNALFIEIVQHGCVDIVKFFWEHPLSQGISANAKGLALIRAAQCNAPEIAQFLLTEAGRVMSAPDKEYALICAVRAHHRDVAACLLAYFVSDTASLEETKEMLQRIFRNSDDLELIRTLLEHPLGQMVSHWDKSEKIRFKLPVLLVASAGILLSNQLTHLANSTQHSFLGSESSIVSLPLIRMRTFLPMMSLITAGLMAVPPVTTRFFPSNPAMQALSGWVNRQTVLAKRVPERLKREVLIATAITKDIFSSLFPKPADRHHVAEEVPTERVGVHPQL